MSTPKIIRVYSPSSKSQNNKQTTCTQGPRQRSSLDTIVSTQKTSQMENYYSLLIDQVKKLSRDNDRMWKLLTETEEQHSECNKTQSQLQKSLESAEKQLALVKEMYDTEKSNFEQSKTFFEKRQIEWQQIVGELKKVIQTYESTNNLDMQRASQIFNQTNGMRFPYGVDQLSPFEKQLSIYSKRNQNQSEESQIGQQIQSHYPNDYYGQTDEGSHAKYMTKHAREQSESGSVMSNGEKKHRSKLFRSKNFINKNNGASLSAKKICQKIYTQQINRLEYCGPSNPEDAIQILTMEDIFERSLRKTYIHYRDLDQRARHILELPHMQKLRTAKSSTKERLNKTIRKQLFVRKRVFVFDSQQELEDVIKYIEDKVYKKYHLLKGELIFKFLEDKFKECEQIFQSSNSALDRLDREPSDFINGAVMNSKFRNYEQKKKDARSSQAMSLRETQIISQYNQGVNQMNQSHTMNHYNQTTHHDQRDEWRSNCSRSSSQMGEGLSLNSNIKGKNLALTHANNHMHTNNHMGTSLQRDIQKSQQRDNSKKNIYTEQRLSRRGFVEQLSRSNKSVSIQSSEMTKNLSSLIGASQEYEINTIGYSNRNDSLKGAIYNNRTSDESRI